MRPPCREKSSKKPFARLADGMEEGRGMHGRRAEERVGQTTLRSVVRLCQVEDGLRPQPIAYPFPGSPGSTSDGRMQPPNRLPDRRIRKPDRGNEIAPWHEQPASLQRCSTKGISRQEHVGLGACLLRDEAVNQDPCLSAISVSETSRTVTPDLPSNNSPKDSAYRSSRLE